MKKYLWTITAIVLLTFASCQKKYEVEADRQTLVKLTADDWDANFLSGNLEANVNLYTENALRIWDGKVYSGKDAIRTLFSTDTEGYKILKHENKVEDMRISGDLATVRGSFLGSFIHKESGDTINIKEVWVDICERQSDGSWKMTLTIIAELKD
jgi:uncharacterized protein (TIGR02246 family)